MKVRKLSENIYLDFHYKKVVFKIETKSFYEYKIFGKIVVMYKDLRKPLCTCEHASLWSVNKPLEFCKHIKLVRHAIKKRKKFAWSWFEQEVK